MYDCSEVQLPTGLIGLGDYCFQWSEYLTSINIPEGVTSLGDYCFSNCISLTSITLPESVTSIGDNCFEVCIALTSITIPENVTSLGVNCFFNCISLILATVLPATPPTLGAEAFYHVHSSFNIKVRSPYVNAYKTATNWINFADRISAI
jgi:hypothetical protein